MWVGFLYTFVVKVPSDWGVTKMSKKGIKPSGPDSSTVNWMELSTVLMCWKTYSWYDVVELQMCHQHTFSRSLGDSAQY